MATKHEWQPTKWLYEAAGGYIYDPTLPCPCEGYKGEVVAETVLPSAARIILAAVGASIEGIPE